MADVIKRRAVFDFYRKRSDITVMQETHSTKETANQWSLEWGGEIIFSHGESNARGVCICIKKNLDLKITDVQTDQNGRFIIFDITDKNRVVTCVALYAPNKDVPDFFANIGNLLENRSEHKIILGDFNLVLNESQDRNTSTHGSSNNKRAAIQVKELMSEYQLIDLWRVRNENITEYSWFKGSENKEGFRASRIDLILISKGLDQMAKNVMFLPGIKTDHRALLATIVDNKHSRGVGYWKINNSLLNNDDYVQVIGEEIEKIKKLTTTKSHKEIWETVKMRVKKVTQNFARRKVGIDSLIISQLTEKLSDFQSRMPLTEIESKMYVDTLKDFEERSFERSKSLIFRSKAKWCLEGEKKYQIFLLSRKG